MTVFIILSYIMLETGRHVLLKNYADNFWHIDWVKETCAVVISLEIVNLTFSHGCFQLLSVYIYIYIYM